MAARGTVTTWIENLQHGDPHIAEEAVRQLWRRYSDALRRLARRRLGERVRRREDEEDVLQSAFKSFCLRQQQGQFDIADRCDLWTLLAMLISRKAATTLRRHGRQRRDFRCEESADRETSNGDVPNADRLGIAPAKELPADYVVSLEEELELRLQTLPEALRQIAVWRLAGYTVDEIAGPDKLDCATRTVERKLQRIRRIWQRTEER